MENQNMKKIMRKLAAVLAVLAMAVTCLEGGAGTVRAAVPALSNTRYVKTYTLSAGSSTPVYADSSLKQRGTASPLRHYNASISPLDEIYILRMDRDAAYVSYPTSSGRRCGYIRVSAVTSNNYSQDAKRSKGSFTTYVRPGSKSYGSVANGDSVYTVASSNGYKQIIYNVGSLWKMAWAKDADYTRYIAGGSGSNPQGCLDAVSSKAPGQITVEGWTFDRDNLNAKLKVHVYVGGPAGSGAPGYEITANRKRADVNRVYTNVGEYHGFSENINVSRTGNQTVYVYAINVGGGSNVLVGTRTVYIQDKKPGGYSPQGWLDSVVSSKDSQITVAGWAFDRDSLATALQIHVYVGGPAGSGAPGYAITANRQRKDVDAAYPGVGINHGFSQSINVTRTGTQPVYVYAINAGKGGQNVLIGTKTVNIRGGSTGGAFQWPVQNMYVCGNDWSEYYSAKGKDHLGVDIKSRSGSTDVCATADGTVVLAGYNSANGNCVVIRHVISGKTVYSFYGHLKSICVSTNRGIRKGEKLGVIGTTGSSSTGVHLHFAFTTQCSLGTWGYGTVFSNGSNTATYQKNVYYNPHYVVANGRLP